MSEPATGAVRDPELEQFFAAILADDDRAILAAWSPGLEEQYVVYRHGQLIGPISAAHMGRLQRANDRHRAARRVAKACDAEDDRAIADAHHRYAALFEGPAPAQGWFDQARVDDALRRQRLLDDVRAALDVQPPDDVAVDQAYVPELDPERSRFLASEYVRIDQARARVAAYAQFAEARDADDDEEIAVADVPPLRESSQLRPSDFDRLRLAHARVGYLRRFEEAASSDDATVVKTGFDTALHGRLRPELQARLDAARSWLDMQMQVRKALEGTGDDQAITDAYRGAPVVFARPAFDDDEQARITLALQRVDAYVRFRAAVEADDDDAVRTGASELAGSSLLTTDDLARIELAVRRQRALEALAAALATDKDDAYTSLDHEVLLADEKRVPKEHRDRIALALRRGAALDRLSRAVTTDDCRETVAAAREPVLRGHAALVEHRERIDAAKRVVEALDELAAALGSDDEARIVTASSPPLIQRHPELLRANERIRLANDRVKALAEIRAALVEQDDWELAALYARYKKVLQGAAGFDALQPACERARAVVKAVRAFTRALRSEDDRIILKAYTANRRLLDGRPEFDESSQARLREAQERMAALDALLAVVDGGSHEDVLAAADERLDGRKEVPARVAERVARARRWRDMPAKIDAAIDCDDDHAIVAAFEEALAEPGRLSDRVRRRIDEARRRVAEYQELRRAIEAKDAVAILEVYVDALRGTAILTPDDLRDVLRAAQQVLAFSDADPTGLRAWIDDGELVAQWKSPASRFVDAVLVVWRTDRQPTSPYDGMGHARVVWPPGRLRAPLGDSPEAYVRAYGMMTFPEAFSSGADRSAACTARRRCTVLCTLSPDVPILDLRTEDGAPLPDVIVTFRHDRPALSAADSHHSVEVDVATAASSVPLRRVGSRGRTFVRVFPADEACRGWAQISHAGVHVLPGTWIDEDSSIEWERIG